MQAIASRLEFFFVGIRYSNASQTMQNKSDVVITGVGVISPIGIGADNFGMRSLKARMVFGLLIFLTHMVLLFVLVDRCPVSIPNSMCGLEKA